MRQTARQAEKGYRVVDTDVVVVAAVSQQVILTDENHIGAEIHNAGVNTIYITPYGVDADADGYELLEGERMYLVGGIGVFSTDGSTLKIMRVA